MKSLPVTLFRELVPLSGFLITARAFKKMFRTPPVLKIVPKAGYGCTLEKIYQ
jgi:hypothetical protein